MRSLVLCSVLAAAAARSPTLVRLAQPPRTARRSAATPLRVRGGGAAAAPVKTGKVWKPNTFTRDHVRFLAELPRYLGAYVGPAALKPVQIEAVMLTVNSINTCPYCTGLHGQLARMADTVVDQGAPEVKFAKVFAEESGRGPKVDAAFSALVSALGAGRARSARALCWALLWGKTTGNTINSIRGKLLGLRGVPSPFELLVFAFYAPLFLVIGVLNAGLRVFPKVPAWFSAAFGAVLWVPQAVHIACAGAVSLACRVLVAPFAGLPSF